MDASNNIDTSLLREVCFYFNRRNILNRKRNSFRHKERYYRDTFSQNKKLSKAQLQSLILSLVENQANLRLELKDLTLSESSKIRRFLAKLNMNVRYEDCYATYLVSKDKKKILSKKDIERYAEEFVLEQCVSEMLS